MVTGLIYSGWIGDHASRSFEINGTWRSAIHFKGSPSYWGDLLSGCPEPVGVQISWLGCQKASLRGSLFDLIGSRYHDWCNPVTSTWKAHYHLDEYNPSPQVLWLLSIVLAYSDLILGLCWIGPDNPTPHARCSACSSCSCLWLHIRLSLACVFLCI